MAMAMAMRVTARTALKAPTTLLFTTLSSNSTFTPPPIPESNSNKRPQADPSTNLFISGLSKRTTNEGLRDFAAKFGNVLSARVVTDRVNGYSKGFGFVNYASLEDSAEGIKGMDGKYLDGWVIFAEYARPKPEFPQRPEYPQSYPGSFQSRRD